MTPYYFDDMVTLYLGDCLEVTAWLDADALVTDPPYGQAYESDQFGEGPRMRGEGKVGTNSVANDHDAATRDAALAAWGSKKPWVCFGNWRVERPTGVNHRLLWVKNGRYAGPMGGNDKIPWFPADEEIYVSRGQFLGPPDRNIYATDESRSQAPSRNGGHPTPKPNQLMEQLLMKCRPEWVIADPFAGSGATLIAARNLGRKAIGVEIEERYCELIANRLSQDVLPL